MVSRGPGQSSPLLLSTISPLLYFLSIIGFLHLSSQRPLPNTHIQSVCVRVRACVLACVYVYICVIYIIDVQVYAKMYHKWFLVLASSAVTIPFIDSPYCMLSILLFQYISRLLHLFHGLRFFLFHGLQTGMQKR